MKIQLSIHGWWLPDYTDSRVAAARGSASWGTQSCATYHAELALEGIPEEVLQESKS